jgi:inorganic pyrophosphatase
LNEIQEFFETYKRLEPHKWAKAKGWKNAEEAFEIVNYSLKKYQQLNISPVR